MAPQASTTDFLPSDNSIQTSMKAWIKLISAKANNIYQTQEQAPNSRDIIEAQQTYKLRYKHANILPLLNVDNKERRLSKSFKIHMSLNRSKRLKSPKCTHPHMKFQVCKPTPNNFQLPIFSHKREMDRSRNQSSADLVKPHTSLHENRMKFTLHKYQAK